MTKFIHGLNSMDIHIKDKQSFITRLEVVCPPLTSKDKKKSIYLHTLVPKLDLKLHFAPPKSLINWSSPQGFDVAVVVSFGYFIPPSLLNTFTTCLNIHPSLLPKYRGASPIQYTILNKDLQCGTSIIELDPTTFDAGNIVNQKSFPLKGTEHFKELHDFLAKESADLLIDTLKDLDMMIVNSKVQAGDISFAKKIEKGRGKIDFKNCTADQVYVMFKAFGPKVFKLSI